MDILLEHSNKLIDETNESNYRDLQTIINWKNKQLGLKPLEETGKLH